MHRIRDPCPPGPTRSDPPPTSKAHAEIVVRCPDLERTDTPTELDPEIWNLVQSESESSDTASLHGKWRPSSSVSRTARTVASRSHLMLRPPRCAKRNDVHLSSPAPAQQPIQFFQPPTQGAPHNQLHRGARHCPWRERRKLALDHSQFIR